MDQDMRELLTAIRDALVDGEDLQRFRVVAALDEVLRPSSTATPQWATDFIHKPPEQGFGSI